MAEHNLKEDGLDNVADLTVIGVTTHKGKPSLLYLARRTKSDAVIRNLIQQSALILGNSRDTYYHQLYCLLSLLDGRKAELVYLGGRSQLRRSRGQTNPLLLIRLRKGFV